MEKEEINLGAQRNVQPESYAELLELREAELALIGGGFGDVTLS